MKRLKAFIIFLLGLTIGALIAVGIYFLTVSDVAWNEYIETKLIPNAVLALSVVSSLCVAAFPLVKKIQNSVTNFNQATDDVNATVKNDRIVLAKLDTYEQRLEALIFELQTLKSDVSETVAPIEEKVNNIEKVVHIGFCNCEELVKKGYAREIERVGKKDEE